MPYKDPEKRKIQQKIYYENNKQKILRNSKEYYENNKQKMLENAKSYNQSYNHTPARKKTYTIGNWKKRGLIGNYDEIYERYINTDNCDNCNIKLCKCGDSTNNNFKVMDHSHITGEFRNILCNSCNTERW